MKDACLPLKPVLQGKTYIGDDVTVWGQCGIIKDISVGSRAVILSKSLITKSIKGDTVYIGNPARQSRKYYKEMAFLRMLPSMMNEKDKTETES